MDDVERKAEFYAKLANVKDLKSLPPADKVQLMIDAVKAGLLSPAFLPGFEFDAGPGFPPAPKRKKANQGRSVAWFFIEGIHPWARKIISDLVDTGKADFRQLEDAAIKHQWRPEVYILHKKTRRITPRPTQDGVMYAGLLEVIDPFLFDRCQECTNFFVHAKNQKYCSKPCSTKSLQPWKRKYMKGYMQERRRAGDKRK